MCVTFGRSFGPRYPSAAPFFSRENVYPPISSFFSLLFCSLYIANPARFLFSQSSYAQPPLLSPFMDLPSTLGLQGASFSCFLYQPYFLLPFFLFGCILYMCPTFFPQHSFCAYLVHLFLATTFQPPSPPLQPILSCSPPLSYTYFLPHRSSPCTPKVTGPGLFEISPSLLPFLSPISVILLCFLITCCPRFFQTLTFSLYFPYSFPLALCYSCDARSFPSRLYTLPTSLR